MQTISQLLSLHPALAASTANLQYKKRLRRMVIESVLKLEGSTSKRDLVKKVVADITSTDTKLSTLFSAKELQTFSKDALIYNFIEPAVALSINTYTGVLQKSSVECDLLWQRASKTKLKHAEGNTDVHLSGANDCYRVYITNSETRVAQIDNVMPALFMDKSIKERDRFQTPRQLTLVELTREKALMLFHDYSNNHQRRFVVPMSKLKGYVFEPIKTHYVQNGTHLVHKDYSGDEFAVNKYGEHVGEKDGVEPRAYVIDCCWRGRKGDFGPKGDRGEPGRSASGFTGKSIQQHLDYAKELGKRVPSSRDELYAAFDGDSSYYIPFTKKFFDEIRQQAEDAMAL